MCRAVDQDGQVLDILVQKRRNTGAAKRFFRTLLKGLQYVPSRLVTDELRSYRAAQHTTLPLSSTARPNTPTIVPKCPTNPPANANDRCAASNLCDLYNGFFPSIVP